MAVAAAMTTTKMALTTTDDVDDDSDYRIVRTGVPHASRATRTVPVLKLLGNTGLISFAPSAFGGAE